jgi:NAD+ kinase
VKVKFYINVEKPAACAAAKELKALAASFGLTVAARGRADAVIALGGDGTILRAVHECAGVPVLGFNLGGLGYLSSVGRGDFGTALQMLAAGRFTVSERTMLEVRKVGARRRKLALNDVVVVRELSGHAAVLDLEVDGSPATRYMADGLVIATPTGSTAYSLAAGGPVVMPDSRSFAVTPMNPHALAVRPLVVSDAVRLTVTSRRRNGRAEKIGVYADGEGVFQLDGDEAVIVAKAPVGAKMIALEGSDPYETLGRKLGWSGTSVRS